jgi:hypothetical protein
VAYWRVRKTGTTSGVRLFVSKFGAGVYFFQHTRILASPRLRGSEAAPTSPVVIPVPVIPVSAFASGKESGANAGRSGAGLTAANPADRG